MLSSLNVSKIAERKAEFSDKSGASVTLLFEEWKIPNNGDCFPMSAGWFRHRMRREAYQATKEQRELAVPELWDNFRSQNISFPQVIREEKDLNEFFTQNKKAYLVAQELKDANASEEECLRIEKLVKPRFGWWRIWKAYVDDICTPRSWMSHLEGDSTTKANSTCFIDTIAAQKKSCLLIFKVVKSTTDVSEALVLSHEFIPKGAAPENLIVVLYYPKKNHYNRLVPKADTREILYKKYGINPHLAESKQPNPEDYLNMMITECIADGELSQQQLSIEGGCIFSEGVVRRNIQEEARKALIKAVDENVKSNFDLAIKEAKKAISLEPNYPEGYLVLGLIYKKISHYPRTIDCAFTAYDLFSESHDSNKQVKMNHCIQVLYDAMCCQEPMDREAAALTEEKYMDSTMVAERPRQDDLKAKPLVFVGKKRETELPFFAKPKERARTKETAEKLPIYLNYSVITAPLSGQIFLRSDVKLAPHLDSGYVKCYTDLIKRMHEIKDSSDEIFIGCSTALSSLKLEYEQTDSHDAAALVILFNLLRADILHQAQGSLQRYMLSTMPELEQARSIVEELLDVYPQSSDNLLVWQQLLILRLVALYAGIYLGDKKINHQYLAKSIDSLNILCTLANSDEVDLFGRYLLQNIIDKELREAMINTLNQFKPTEKSEGEDKQEIDTDDTDLAAAIAMSMSGPARLR